PEDVLYKFAIRDSSGEWKVIQDYSEKNSVNYNIPFSGDLRVVVHVKHKLSSKAYDDYDLRDFNVKYSTVALGEFNVDGANIVEHDIVMNAKANPQNEALYKFAIRNPNGEWIVIQDYSSKNNSVYVPKEPGEYRVC
ncbi:hypothetical protein, partial [Clostridium perfringens]|uniref:hypothetical protein n=1 Tax=Clostridium perfringens TaxID=1502 RepID=UPI002ACBEACE